MWNSTTLQRQKPLLHLLARILLDVQCVWIMHLLVIRMAVVEEEDEAMAVEVDEVLDEVVVMEDEEEAEDVEVRRA